MKKIRVNKMCDGNACYGIKSTATAYSFNHSGCENFNAKTIQIYKDTDNPNFTHIDYETGDGHYFGVIIYNPMSKTYGGSMYLTVNGNCMGNCTDQWNWPDIPEAPSGTILTTYGFLNYSYNLVFKNGLFQCVYLTPAKNTVSGMQTKHTRSSTKNSSYDPHYSKYNNIIKTRN
jgi:hypothetical protein